MQSAIALFMLVLLSGNPQLSPQDLKAWDGIWNGTLTYRDYTSDQMVTLQLSGDTRVKGNKLVLDYVMKEWGKKYKQHYVYRIQDGTLYSGGAWKMLEKSAGADGNLRFVATQIGKDGNEQRPCTFRLTFDYEGNRLTITKEVRFEGEDQFFLRNEYRLQRIGG